MPYWELHITGQVQGVGFRPRVYDIALKHGIKGSVSNGMDGVRVKFSAADAREAGGVSQLFLDDPPRLAVVTGHHLRPLNENIPEGFTIRNSEAGGKATLLLSPDFGICQNCRQDITTEGRREGYAFTTCTDCGPRYSITKRLPYDRAETTMAGFAMCPSCREEYHDPGDRRFYSQTNSCPECGVRLQLDGNEDLSQEAVINAVAAHWKAGKIVAVKGIGGFLLTCDANSPDAVGELRARKHRPDKPLAVMYPDLDRLRASFDLSPPEREALLSSASPIVLLRPKENIRPGLALEDVAPGLRRVGIMLPYTPLFQLLLTAFGGPIVATSGNVSGEPIVFRSGDADRLGTLADHTLDHNLDLLCPQDDSVASFTKSGKRILLRRSRGLAPSFLRTEESSEQKDIFAVGADLKASFCFHHGGNTYVSQYLGDLGSFTAQEQYQLTVRHLRTVLQASPRVVLRDFHPSYASTGIAERFSQECGVPTVPVQHHEAHFAAILGEHNLLDHPSAVLGIIWDGTGYGTDGNIWGGETFLYRDYRMRRISHLDYFPHFAGDKLPREPRLAALALAHHLPAAQELLGQKFTAPALKNYGRLIARSQLKSSSMGRLFDAVASFLIGTDSQSYEGMAAGRLEALAEARLSRAPALVPYPVQLTQTGNIPGGEIIGAVVDDLAENICPGRIAARFHLTLVDLIHQLADGSGSRHLAFSGGVFQNALLVQLLEEKLSGRYQLYFHRSLSPNDENIAFGQLTHYFTQQRALRGTSPEKTTEHVLSYSR